MSTSNAFSKGQQPIGFLDKSEMTSANMSHDNHMLPNITGSSDNGCAVFDETVLLEDPFYNFDEMDHGSMAVQSMINPSDPNSIPFYDDCFASTAVPPDATGGAEFDPELFNSILSSGDDILARLSSSSASEGAGSLDVPRDGGVAGGGAERGQDEEEEEPPDYSTAGIN